MKKNFNSDALDMIAERAFSEGYKQGALEKMFATEDTAKKAAEDYLDKAKAFLWGKEGGWKENWGRRSATIAVPTATAAGLAYLAHKRKKAREAAEALEEAAEDQRAYSEYLSQKMYAAKQAAEENGGLTENQKLGLEALGLSTATGAGIYGVSKANPDIKKRLQRLVNGKEELNAIEKVGKRVRQAWGEGVNLESFKKNAKGRAALAGIAAAPAAGLVAYNKLRKGKAEDED